MHKLNLCLIRKYLKNGIYKYNDDFTQISLNKNEINHFKDNHINKNIKYILKLVYRFFFRIPIFSFKKFFWGDTLLIPSNKYGYKFFDKEQVCTFYYDVNLLEQYLVKRENMTKIFNAPDIIQKNNNYIIEKKINTINFNKSDILKAILNRYIIFFSNNNIKLDSFKIKEKKYIDENELKEFYDQIKLRKDFDTIMQHGDLWTANILVNKETSFYVIDFENVSYKYILYDFFTYIYNEALVYNDYLLASEYFEGEYDLLLGEYFKKLGLKFDKKNKVEYFNFFINQLLDIKFANYDKQGYFSEINKMKDIYSKIIAKKGINNE